MPVDVLWRCGSGTRHEATRWAQRRCRRGLVVSARTAGGLGEDVVLGDECRPGSGIGPDRWWDLAELEAVWVVVKRDDVRLLSFKERGVLHKRDADDAQDGAEDASDGGDIKADDDRVLSRVQDVLTSSESAGCQTCGSSIHVHRADNISMAPILASPERGEE